MKQASANLLAILAKNTFINAYLFKFSFKNGTTLYYTDADVDIIFNTNIYLSDAPLITGVNYKLARGIEVNTFDLELTVKPTHTINNQSWLVAVRSGALDGILITIYKAFLNTWTDIAEGIHVFTGYVGEATHSNQLIKLSLKSDADKLNTPIPKLMYQSACTRTLYDAGCGISKNNFNVQATITAGSNLAVLQTNFSQSTNWANFGYLVFQNGQNIGVMRSIKRQTNGILELSRPLEFMPSSGDLITVFAGCDKTQATCTSKFNNVINFKAYPYVPKPETIL